MHRYTEIKQGYRYDYVSELQQRDADYQETADLLAEIDGPNPDPGSTATVITAVPDDETKLQPGDVVVYDGVNEVAAGGIRIFRDLGEPQQYRVARDGVRDLAFRGWLLGEGDRSFAGGPYTTVEVYLTAAGAIVTSVEQGTMGEGVGSARAAAHETPEAALAWLIEDAGGELGPASKEAWEAAGSAYPPIAEHAVERIA
jgi:hypothetical protein